MPFTAWKHTERNRQRDRKKYVVISGGFVIPAVQNNSLKFVFSRKATKFDKIFTVDLTLCRKCQIDGEDFVNFCGLLRKHELYLYMEFS